VTKDKILPAKGFMAMFALLMIVAYLGGYLFQIIEAFAQFLATTAPLFFKMFLLVLYLESFLLISAALGGILESNKESVSLTLLYSSFFYGAITWIWGFLVLYYIWGDTGVFVGLSFFGVGVVPLGFLAALLNALNGHWIPLAQITFGIVLTYGTWAMGAKLIGIAPHR
jgi:hypothetical protein